MKIHIGSKSPTKVKAITDIVKDYDLFKNATCENFAVQSGVSDQPMTMQETINGAKNRAERCFEGADYSFAIESGLMEVPETKSGYMNISVCAIYDGREFHLGIASLFEYPKEVIRLVKEKGLEISHAFKAAGFTDKDKIGYEEGVIGAVTKGRVNSEKYFKEAVVAALIHLENPDMY